MTRYVPSRGDVVWLQFDPQAGHEQAGRRPALVISPERYNRVTGLMVCCPVTSKIKNYPFEVAIELAGTQSAVISDQVKSLDWEMRKAQFFERAPLEVLNQVQGKLKALLEI